MRGLVVYLRRRLGIRWDVRGMYLAFLRGSISRCCSRVLFVSCMKPFDFYLSLIDLPLLADVQRSTCEVRYAIAGLCTSLGFLMSSVVVYY